MLPSERLGRWFCVLCAALVCCVAAVAARGAEPDRHVVILSIDGLASYLLDDVKAPLPNIRQLAKSGAVAAGGMTVSNPSVTWPNHTSLVTGSRPELHGVLANGVLVRGGIGLPTTVDPRKDKHELVRVPTIYDAAHAAGLSTAEVNWPCTRGAKTLGDSFPDVPDAVTHCTPRLRKELVSLGLLPDETDKRFMDLGIVTRDYVWTEAACHVIRQRRPNLLLLHLLNVDSTHHAHGAQSGPGYTSNAYADMCVGRVLAALDDAGIRERSTIFIVADHGFALTPKALCPNVVLRQKGFLSVAGGKIGDAQMHVFPEGGIGLVYCTDPGAAQADRKRFRELFDGKEGVAEILEPEQFAEHGLPHPREYAQAPDLVLVAKDGYGVSGSADGETFVVSSVEGRVSAGSHGFIATLSKMNAVCVISGDGVRAGARLEKVENIDIAPTVARILGLKDFGATGRVLVDALQ
jgi:predicted AlkP superfamily pyrophosphatase or phosphodiesterase